MRAYMKTVLKKIKNKVILIENAFLQIIVDSNNHICSEYDGLSVKKEAPQHFHFWIISYNLSF